MTRVILTCSPDFTDLALNEVRRHHPDITILQHISRSYIFLQAPHTFDVLTAPWRHHPAVYIHHMFPVHSIIPLDSLDQLQQAAQQLAPPDATVQLRSLLESDPRYPLAQLQSALNAHPPTDLTQPPTGRILSILITPDQPQPRVYMGISWATQNLSPWAGGQLPMIDPVSNRAGFKLIESLETFCIRLRRNDHALDLGASPGAWTTILRQRGLRVTAVAPTPLYPWLALDSGVTYQPCLAEDYLNTCQTTFDLIVNDMKLDPQDSARLMVDYAQHLRPEGICIMTLKLREHGKQRVMDHAFRLLRKAYKIIQVRQLVSNGKEVTLFLRRKE